MVIALNSNRIGLVVFASVDSIMKTDVTATTTNKQHHMTKQYHTERLKKDDTNKDRR